MAVILHISIGLLVTLCVWLVIRARIARKDDAAKARIVELILKNIDAYVLLIDSDFNVLKTNYYMLTDTPEAVVPPKVGNLLHCKNGDDAGQCGNHELCATCPVRTAIGETFRTRQNFTGLEAPMVLYTSADSTSTVECEVSVTGHYLDIDGKSHQLLTIHDITAQKHTQRELTAARQRAEESDRMKSIFLANTSHELRTPLNAIIGFSELLVAEVPPEEKQEYVRIIRSNGETLLRMVQDILDLSKIETGTLEYKYADTELNAMMEELEGTFHRKQIPQNRVRLEFRRSCPLCYLQTDRQRLSQVVSNLLSNAVKFTVRGEIRFGFEVRGEEIYFYVSDTGCGISAGEAENLFRRFNKAGSYKQGIGIGLAISKSIVEAMNGRIGVESEVGKGSTFWFTLPISVRTENEQTA